MVSNSKSSIPQSKSRLQPGLVPMALCMPGALILAFLILFGQLSSCSEAAIAIFLVMLGISMVLVMAGTVSGGISYRRTRSRIALFSLLFSAIYAGLLVYLIGLIY